MRRLITIALLLCSMGAMAQTNQPLPGDAQPLTNQLYLSPSDSTVWAANEFDGLAIKVGTWHDIDALFKLGYTKVQVDSAIFENTSNFIKNSASYTGGDFSVETGKVRGTFSAAQRTMGQILPVTDTIYFFGNSVTLGTGSSPNTNRYANRVLANLGGSQRNFGIGSSCMQMGIPPRPLGARGMMDTLEAIPIKQANIRFISIAYGLNDMGSNRPDYTPEKFKEAYNRVLDTISARGWLMSEVLIVSPIWVPDAGYVFYSTVNGGQGVPTRSRHIQYVNAAREVSEARGTLFIDMYTDMLNGGAGTLIAADSLHPNNAGHQFMADRISEVIRGAVPSASSLEVTPTLITANSGIRLNNSAATITSASNKINILPGLGGFSGELAIINTSYSYSSPDYWGAHILPIDDLVVIESVGRNTQPAKPMLFSLSSGGSRTNLAVMGGEPGQSARFYNNVKFDQNAEVTGDLTVTGNLITPRILSAVSSLDFPDTPTGQASALTVSVPGATIGDAVSVGLSTESNTAAYMFTGRVSGTNTVTVKFINMTGANLNPAAQNIKVVVLK